MEDNEEINERSVHNFKEEISELSKKRKISKK
jgi:hypothetical protein